MGKKYSYEAQHAKEKLKFIINAINKFKIKTKKGSIKILDVGCGEGDISFHLARLNYRIVATDSDKDAIKYCKNISKFKNLKFVLSDAENMSSKEKFDVIICSEVLEHVNNPEKLVYKLSRILNQNGLMIITIPNGYGPFEIFYNTPVTFILRRIDKMRGIERPGFYHCQHFTLNEIKIILENNNLKITDKENAYFLSFLPLIRDMAISKLDVLLARKLPYWLSSGWYLVCERQHPQSS